MNFFNQGKELILAHKDMATVNIGKSVNIMLSPQFYTLKREALPVKYAHQAKKIAPSIFDGLVENSREYEYFVSKDDEEWILIAYNSKEILDFLQSKGFKRENISKLYFAQQSVSMFNRPIYIGDKNALVSIDNTMVVIPKIVLAEDEESSLNFTDLFTPKQSVSIKTTSSSSNTFSTTDTIIISTIFAIFGILFIVEGFGYGGNNSNRDKFDELIASNLSLQSAYSRKSIIQKYKIIDKLERSKRDNIKNISSIIFKGVKLTNLNLNDKKIEASFICSNKAVSNKLKDIAIKKHFKVLNITGTNDLLIRKSL